MEFQKAWNGLPTSMEWFRKVDSAIRWTSKSFQSIFYGVLCCCPKFRFTDLLIFRLKFYAFISISSRLFTAIQMNLFGLCHNQCTQKNSYSFNSDKYWSKLWWKFVQFCINFPFHYLHIKPQIVVRRIWWFHILKMRNLRVLVLNVWHQWYPFCRCSNISKILILSLKLPPTIFFCRKYLIEFCTLFLNPLT